MNYILIFVFMWGAGREPTSQSVKFHSLKACQAAASELSRKAKEEGHALPVLICAREHM